MPDYDTAGIITVHTDTLFFIGRTYLSDVHMDTARYVICCTKLNLQQITLAK